MVLEQLTEVQLNTLSNANAFTLFLYISDYGEASLDQLARKTGCSLLEVSDHLERLIDAKLVRQVRTVQMTSKVIQVTHKAVDETYDLSPVTSKMSEGQVLELLLSKIRSDYVEVSRKRDEFHLSHSQIRVKSDAYEKIRNLMHLLEQNLQAEDNPDGED